MNKLWQCFSKIRLHAQFAMLSCSLALFAAAQPLLAAPPASPAAAPVAAPAVLDAQQTEETLHDLMDTLKRLKRANAELYAEVNRRQSIIVPDIVDALVMSPYAADPGLMPTGFANDYETVKTGPLLPPRTKYVNLSMDNLSRVVTLLQSDCTALTGNGSALMSLSDDLRAEAKVFRDNCNQVGTIYSQLQTLTVGPKYDNVAISRATRSVSDEIDGLNDIRKRLLKLLKDADKGKR